MSRHETRLVVRSPLGTPIAATLVAYVVVGCAVSDTRGRSEPSARPAASAPGLASSAATSSAAVSSPAISSPAISSPAIATGAPSSALASSGAVNVVPPAPSGSASGGASSVEGAPPCPPNMAQVGRYCIDQYEDALEEAGEDGVFAPHPHYERPPSDKRFRAVTAAGQFPQGYISRVEAKAACEASGKRLCTKREWQHACRGKGFQTYPYGERGVRSQCNTGKIHLLSQMFKNPPGGMKYDEHFNSPELDKTPGFLAKTAEYEGCKTELGVFDMVGNLHEWVSDTVTQELVDKLEDDDVERRKQPWREGNGVFMGGFFSTTSEHGPGCHFITIAHEPSYHDYSTGFRCCEDAAVPKASRVTPIPKKKRP